MWWIMGLSILGVLVAMIVEYLNQQISPWIWLAGGILAHGLNYLGYGLVSWKEGLIISLAVYVFIVLIYQRVSSMFGGGALKGVCFCGACLGRYIILLAINLSIVIAVTMLVKRNNRIPGGKMVLAMPLLLIGMVMTYGEYFMLKRFI